MAQVKDIVPYLDQQPFKRIEYRGSCIFVRRFESHREISQNAAVYLPRRRQGQSIDNREHRWHHVVRQLVLQKLPYLRNQLAVDSGALRIIGEFVTPARCLSAGG